MTSTNRGWEIAQKLLVEKLKQAGVSIDSDSDLRREITRLTPGIGITFAEASGFEVLIKKEAGVLGSIRKV